MQELRCDVRCDVRSAIFDVDNTRAMIGLNSKMENIVCSKIHSVCTNKHVCTC